MRCAERDRLLDEYAARTREFAKPLSLRKTSNEVEAFINVLDEGRTGPPQVRTVAHSSG